MDLCAKSQFCQLMMVFQMVTSCISVMPAQDIRHAQIGPTFSKIGDYRIGPGDELLVRVFGEEAFSGTYVVAPSGMIQIPLVGYVIAGGMTQVQLAQKLELVMKPFVRDAKVAISVTAANSYVVYFSGEVLSRGPKELRSKTNILQGLILAGGLTNFASGDVFLIRTVGEQQVKRYQTTFKELLKGGDALDFLYLERGDIVHVD